MVIDFDSFYCRFVTAVAYYLTYYDAFFKQKPREFTVSVGILIYTSSACNFVGFCCAAVIARNLPRRKCLYVTVFCAVVTQFGRLIKNNYIHLVMLLLGKAISSCQFALVYLITVELAPTPLRGLICGVCFGMSRLGAMISPHVIYIADIWDGLPHLLVGTAQLVCFGAAWALPETKAIKLMHNYCQVREFFKGTASNSKIGNHSRSFESSI